MHLYHDYNACYKISLDHQIKLQIFSQHQSKHSRVDRWKRRNVTKSQTVFKVLSSSLPAQRVIVLSSKLLETIPYGQKLLHDPSLKNNFAGCQVQI